MKEPHEYDYLYFPGLENKAIRYYYYLNAGLNIVNNFRNLILAILGVYIALHLDAWWLLIAMFIPSVLVLTIIGFFVVHRVNKVQEWLSIRFSSHYAMKQFNYNEGIYTTLQEINGKLDKSL